MGTAWKTPVCFCIFCVPWDIVCMPLGAGSARPRRPELIMDYMLRCKKGVPLHKVSKTPMLTFNTRGSGHMILIVIIDSARYMVSLTRYSSSSYREHLELTNNYKVDVGFGINCATAPLPLQEGATATCIAQSEMRLVKETLVEFTDKSQKIWVYQTRKDPESPWLPGICFSEVEFLPKDFEVMNFSVSQRRASWFTHRFVCVRMIMDPESREIIGQCIISGKEVKKRMGAHTEVLQPLENEQDRVNALAKYFGVHFRAHEIEGIRGFVSELK